MAGHYITLCSCGKVIAQCRCPDSNKSKTIIKNGCEECHNKPKHNTKEAKLESKIRAIAEYLGCNEEELVSEILKLFKEFND